MISCIIQRIFFLDEIFYHFWKSCGPRASRTCADQGRHTVEYVKINRSRKLALDGVVDTHMDFISNDAGSSPFSSVFFLLLFTTLSYMTPIMYFEWKMTIWLWGIHSSYNRFLQSLFVSSWLIHCSSSVSFFCYALWLWFGAKKLSNVRTRFRCVMLTFARRVHHAWLSMRRTCSVEHDWNVSLEWTLNVQ